jgi:hypothetical protein
MLKRRENRMLNTTVMFQKTNSMESPVKRTYLSLVTPSKSKEKYNKTQETIRVNSSISLEQSMESSVPIDLYNTEVPVVDKWHPLYSCRRDIHRNKTAKLNKFMSLLLEDDFL